METVYLKKTEYGHVALKITKTNLVDVFKGNINFEEFDEDLDWHERIAYYLSNGYEKSTKEEFNELFVEQFKELEKIITCKDDDTK